MTPEADGSAWKREAVVSIKEYFVKALLEGENVIILA